jgi:hypothetical protein
MLASQLKARDDKTADMLEKIMENSNLLMA